MFTNYCYLCVTDVLTSCLRRHRFNGDDEVYCLHDVYCLKDVYSFSLGWDNELQKDAECRYNCSVLGNTAQAKVLMDVNINWAIAFFRRK